MRRLMVFVLCICMMCTFAACAKEDKVDKVEKTLLIGDSLFDLWHDTYETDLEGMPNLKNIAIGGTHSLYWNKGWRVVAGEDPTTIIICVGTNNIADLRETGEEAATGENGIQALLNTLHENCPDAYIYLLTIPICGEQIRWDARDEIKVCNALMREYCEELDWAEIIDVETAFYDDNNYENKPNPDYFQPDYLHFSAEGYQVLTRVMREALGLDQK